jgi:biopolymer transport protein ExbB/TolQ
VIKPLTDSLYLISNALLAPVLLLMILMLGWTLCLLGGFLRELWERKRVRSALSEALNAAVAGRENPADVWSRLGSQGGGLSDRFLARMKAGEFTAQSANHALGNLEHDIAASISRLSLITRVGPMLGLMGTLIPLGPALTGLAGGNVQTLASNLVVAFTTTVVGLLVGGLAYAMGMSRRLWYGRDFGDLERLCELLIPGGGDHAS